MEPKEHDPRLLLGRHVVEVGMRQAWPFLTLADPTTGGEVRLFLDAQLSVSPDLPPVRQDDEALLGALDRLNGGSVTGAVREGDGSLVLQAEGRELRVSGEANELTTGSPWWFGRQRPGDDEVEAAAVTRFGTALRLSVERAFWGSIAPSVRAIALGWSEHLGRVRVVFDAPPSDYDRELVEVAETEVIADLRTDERVEFAVEVDLVGPPRLQPDERWWAYVRHEPDGESA